MEQSAKKAEEDAAAAAAAKAAAMQPGRCSRFINGFILDPLTGDGVTVNIPDEKDPEKKIKVQSYFYWEFVLLW